MPPKWILETNSWNFTGIFCNAWGFTPPELCQNTMAKNLSFGVSKQVKKKSKKYET